MTVSDLFCLFKLLDQVSVFFVIRLHPKVGTFLQLTFFFKLVFAEADVWLLEFVSLSALPVHFAFKDSLLFVDFLFFFDLLQDNCLLATGFSDVLLELLFAASLVDFGVKLALFVLEVLDPCYYFFLVLFGLLKCYLCPTLRVSVGSWLF